VRKILDLVQSKGEEVSEFFLYVLQRLADAYVDLRPWLSEISFSPSQLIQSKAVVNTDPVSRYSQKLRQQLGRDSKFILCYAQKEELLLEEMYTDTIVELVDFGNESLGSLGSLACLLDPSTGVLNEHGETIFVFGDAGVGKSMLLQRLQSLWAAGQLDAELRFFFHFRCRTFSCFKESASLCLRDLLFKHYCYPEQDPEEVQCLGGRGLAGEDPFKNKDHFHFTNLFLCGLLSKGKQKLLRHLVPAAALRRKRRALWACLFASLRSHLKNLPRVQSGSFSQVQAMPTFLWMLRCIYETQSEKVGQLAARGICANYLKLTFCNACSADCSALSFVLHHFPKRLALDLDNNNLNDYGVRELQPCFSRLTVIRLSVNQITDSGVKVLCEELPKYKILTFLGLYNNQITDVGARYVARILDECTGLTHLK
ncbi:Nucleotide-binding oligomerization domain-containing protein 1, partial [Eschrichtius robustus]|nr:Nucleotide-binding oligomerization domain-containing protein 1 [Eschrichtius robustus]